jgi:hypothetical protein
MRQAGPGAYEWIEREHRRLFGANRAIQWMSNRFAARE